MASFTSLAMRTPGAEGARERGRPFRALLAVLVVLLLLPAAPGSLSISHAGSAGRPGPLGTPGTTAERTGPSLGSGVGTLARSVTIASPGPAADEASATVDLLANKVLAGNAAIRYANGLGGIAFDPESGLDFLDGSESSGIVAIHPATGAMTSIARPLITGTDSGVNDAPGPMAFDEVDRQLFVSDPPLASVDVYNLSDTNGTLSYATTIALPANAEPEGIIAPGSPDYVYVADEGISGVSILDPQNDSYIGTVSSLTNPVAVAFDPTDQLVFASDAGSATVSVLEANPPFTANPTEIPIHDDPTMIAFDPVNDTIWAGTAAYLSIISGASEDVVQTLTFAAGSHPEAFEWDAAANQMLIANYPTGDVSFYLPNGTLLTSAPTPGTPGAMVVNTSNREVDAVDLASNSLLRVSGLTDDLINEEIVGVEPGLPAYDPLTDRIEVPDAVSDRVLEVDATATSAGSTPVVRILSVPGRPVAAAFDPPGGFVVVALSDGSVAALNATSGAVEKVVSPDGSNDPTDVLYAAGQIYVCGGPSEVWSLDPVSLTTQATINLVSGAVPAGLTYDPENELLFVTQPSANRISEINVTHDQVAAAFSGGTDPAGIAFDPSNGYLFVADTSSDAVNVVGAISEKSIDVVPVGNSPDQVLYSSQTSEVYVSSTRSNSVALLDGTTFGVIDEVGVGDYPGGLAYDNATGDLYSANAPDSSLSIVPIATPKGVPFAATIVPSPAVTDVHDLVVLNVDASYPPWDFSYDYTELPAGCTGSNTSVLDCYPTLADPSTHLAVEVTSPTGATLNVTRNLTVNTDPVATLNATFAALTLGVTTNLTVNASGGTPPYRYAYSNLPPGCPGPTTPNVTCRPSRTGTSAVQVTVVDAAGYPATANLTITVNSPLSIEPTLSVPQLTLGGSVTITAGVSSGTPPYSYSYGDLPNGCRSANAPSITCTPTGAGNFSIRVNTLDASDSAAEKTINLLVVPVATTSSGSGSSTTLELAAVGAAIVVAAIVAVVLVRRRRPAPPASDAAEAPSEEVYTTRSRDVPRTQVTVKDAPGPAPAEADAPVEADVPTGPRYFESPASSTPARPTPPPAPVTPPAGGARANLVCPHCGTVNEPWLDNCRKCRRPLHSTG